MSLALHTTCTSYTVAFIVFTHYTVYTRDGHTCRDKEPKTIEAIIERAATQSLVYLN